MNKTMVSDWLISFLLTQFSIQHPTVLSLDFRGFWGGIRIDGPAQAFGYDDDNA